MRWILILYLLFMITTPCSAIAEEWTYGSGEGEAITRTSDGNCVFAADDYGLGWIAKINNNGRMQWWNIISYFDCLQVNTAAPTENGGSIIAGSIYNGVNNSDGFVAKYDTDGEQLWFRKYDISDEVVWIYDIVTVDGGYAIAGSFSFNDGIGGPAIARLDNNGGIIWHWIYNTSLFFDRCTGLISTHDGGFLAIGYFLDIQSKAFAVKLSAAGEEEWFRSYDFEYDARPSGICHGIDAGFVIAGKTSTNYPTGTDVFLLKINDAGEEEWREQLIRNGENTAAAIVRSWNGGYVFAGMTSTPAGVYIFRSW